MITFDERKRQANLQKHGIDLAEAEAMFDGPMVSQFDRSEGYGEERITSLGMLHGEVVLLVWTDRKQAPHLISCRKATKHEKKEFIRAIG
jgi:uncharacterized protein